MFNEGNMFMGGMHGLWWIFWLLLVGAIVYGAWGRPGGSQRRPRESPQQLLQRRLASGEISTEEYQKRKTLLDRDAGANA